MMNTEETQRDPRLTEEQQLAVMGHFMSNPEYFRRVHPTLPASYLTSLKVRNLYTYVIDIYSQSSKKISTSELKAKVKQYQTDVQSQKIYCDMVDQAERVKSDYTLSRLSAALTDQQAHYEYLNKMNELAKAAGDGNRNKVMEIAEEVGKLRHNASSEQPTEEENVRDLEEEERRWEESLPNRVPLVTPYLNGRFMLTPGLTMIGGVTKSGKSTVLANLIPAILDAKPDKKVFIITNEDNLDLVTTRIACCALGVSLREYRFERHKMTPEAIELIKQTKRAVATRIVVASMPRYDTSCMEVVQELLEEAKNNNYSAIFLDYYQIVANSKNFKGIEYVGILKKFGTWLKGYGADLKIPTVIFAQLKPMSEKQDLHVSQRVQADQTIVNHVHVALEIERERGDLGQSYTHLVCQVSRHGDMVGRIGTFIYKEGQLIYQAPRT